MVSSLKKKKTKALNDLPAHYTILFFFSFLVAQFKSYCTQICSEELDAVVREFLKEIIRFQKRQYNTNPVKVS